jgi:hypothetical protein
MRMIPIAILLMGGVALSCDDPSQESSTERLSPSFKEENAKKDGVVGSGRFEDLSEFHVSAHSGPAGEDPKGHLDLDLNPERPPANLGKIVCLAVLGNRAAVGAEDQDHPGLTRYVIVEDNGDAGDPTPDRAIFTGTGQLDLCEFFVTEFAGFPIEGDVTVVDAQPDVP